MNGDDITLDEFHRRLGRAIDEWSRVEHWLFQEFVHLTGLEIRRAGMIAGRMTTKPFVELLDGLLSAELDGTDLRHWKSLKRYITDLADDRHLIAHGGVWFKREENPFEAEHFPSLKPAMAKIAAGRERTVRGEELAEIGDDFRHLARCVAEFVVRRHPARKLSGEVARRRPRAKN